jgi:hypothetical protein
MNSISHIFIRIRDYLKVQKATSRSNHLSYWSVFYSLIELPDTNTIAIIDYPKLI